MKEKKSLISFSFAIRDVIAQSPRNGCLKACLVLPPIGLKIISCVYLFLQRNMDYVHLSRPSHPRGAQIPLILHPFGRLARPPHISLREDVKLALGLKS